MTFPAAVAALTGIPTALDTSNPDRKGPYDGSGK